MISKMFPTLALLIMMSCSVAPDKPEEQDVQPEDEFAVVPGGETVTSIEAVGCTTVARVIGLTSSGETYPNPNSTLKRFGMASTDFGNMWDAGNGKVFCIFGDNFDDRNGDWLSNAIAVTTDKNLSDGLYYDSMLWDNASNKRKQIIPRLEGEVTCIPTGGFSFPTLVGVRQFVNFMAIKQWDLGGEADNWAVHYSELSYSDDYGQTWTRSGVRWNGDSKFAQIAYVVRGDTVYMWGTPSGRHSFVYVARVNGAKALDKSQYEYWNGSSWVKDESAAAPVANGEVSEMTVRYNTYYNRYIMMYLNVRERKLVYRDAASPEGEWSSEKIIMDGTYGPSIHPWFCDGRDLWFVSSSVTKGSNPYSTWHIFLYHAKLREDNAGFNMIWEPGFENEPDQAISYKTLWSTDTSFSSHDPHSGEIACYLKNGEPGVWKDACRQTIVVHKNTDYVLTAWAKANVEGHTGAYLGVRLPSGEIHDTNPALSGTEWTMITKEFNSGDNTTLDVFFGTWGAPNLSVYVDDFRLTPRTTCTQ